MSGVLEKAVKMSQLPIKIIYSKEHENEALPVNGINVDDLTTTSGVDLSSLKTSERDQNETALLPYSRCDHRHRLFSNV